MESSNSSWSSAWKGAMRGVRSGYKYTRAVVRGQPSESRTNTAHTYAGTTNATSNLSSSSPAGTGLFPVGLSTRSIRNMFRKRYADPTCAHTSSNSTIRGSRGSSRVAQIALDASVRGPKERTHTASLSSSSAQTSRVNDADCEDDDDKSSEEETGGSAGLDDAEVHRRVEAHYFDPQYNAMRAEIAPMTAGLYAESDDEIRAQRAATEQRISTLRAQCVVVSTTLQKRVLSRQAAFLAGVSQVQQIQDGLFRTSSEAKQTRHALRQGRIRSASQLALLALHRRRANLCALYVTMRRVQQVWEQCAQLAALLAGGQLSAARRLLQQAQPSPTEGEEEDEPPYSMRSSSLATEAHSGTTATAVTAASVRRSGSPGTEGRDAFGAPGSSDVHPSVADTPFTTHRPTASPNNRLHRSCYANMNQYNDSAPISREERQRRRERELHKLVSLRNMTREWAQLQANPHTLADLVEPLLTRCLRVHFVPDTYTSVLAATPALGQSESLVADIVAAQLWTAGVAILTRTLCEVSNCKEEEYALEQLARQVEPDCVALLMCQLGARWADFVRLYRRLIRLHDARAVAVSSSAASSRAMRDSSTMTNATQPAKDNVPASARADTHAISVDRHTDKAARDVAEATHRHAKDEEDSEAVRGVHASLSHRLRDTSRRMARDIVVKMSTVAAQVPLTGVDVETGVHVFVLLALTVEVISMLYMTHSDSHYRRRRRRRGSSTHVRHDGSRLPDTAIQHPIDEDGDSSVCNSPTDRVCHKSHANEGSDAYSSHADGRPITNYTDMHGLECGEDGGALVHATTTGVVVNRQQTMQQHPEHQQQQQQQQQQCGEAEATPCVGCDGADSLCVDDECQRAREDFVGAAEHHLCEVVLHRHIHPRLHLPRVRQLCQAMREDGWEAVTAGLGAVTVGRAMGVRTSGYGVARAAVRDYVTQMARATCAMHGQPVAGADATTERAKEEKGSAAMAGVAASAGHTRDDNSRRNASDAKNHTGSIDETAFDDSDTSTHNEKVATHDKDHPPYVAAPTCSARRDDSTCVENSVVAHCGKTSSTGDEANAKGCDTSRDDDAEANSQSMHRLLFGASGIGDLNPFYAPAMLQPPNLALSYATESLGEYWAAHHVRTETTHFTLPLPGSITPTCHAASSSVSPSLSPATALAHDEAAPHPCTPSSTSAWMVPSLLSYPVVAPTLWSSSALTVASMMLEYQVRMVARWPALAHSVVLLCGDLFALYVYTVVDNFVSISRSVALERQGGLSKKAQEVLAVLRETAQRVWQECYVGVLRTPSTAIQTTPTATTCAPTHQPLRRRGQDEDASVGAAVSARASTLPRCCPEDSMHTGMRARSSITTRAHQNTDPRPHVMPALSSSPGVVHGAPPSHGYNDTHHSNKGNMAAAAASTSGMQAFGAGDEPQASATTTTSTTSFSPAKPEQCRPLNGQPAFGLEEQLHQQLQVQQLQLPQQQQQQQSLLGEESEPEQRFPPRVGQTTRQAMARHEHYYALAQRLIAAESCVSLAVLYESVVRALTFTAAAHTRFLGYSLGGTRHDPSPYGSHAHPRWLLWCRAVYSTMVEVEHVCVHRLCQATLPLEEVSESIAKLRGSTQEVRVSDYVGQTLTSLRALLAQRPALATPVMEVLFLRRLLFSVQTTLVREYSKLARKKLSDVMVMQMQVDVQTLLQEMREMFGQDSVVLPGYALNLVKTGFYRTDRAQGMAWVRRYHAYYAAVDLLNWFGGSDKTYRMQMQDLLTGPLEHEDVIPVTEFLA